MGPRVLAGIFAFSLAAQGADLSAGLLAAAAGGSTSEVKSLLDKGAKVDARDKKQRTPLMLAAQHGHAETARLLLSKGADADARDRDGFTAYGLTVFSPAGHGNHEEALQALPPAPRVRLALTTEVSTTQTQSSCFMSRGELPVEIEHLRLDATLREEFLAFAAASGKGLLEIVPGRSDPADALAVLTLVPAVSCAGAQGDTVSMELKVRVVRSRDQQVLLEKVIGGGVKGLRGQWVNNPAQYGPVLQSKIRPQAAPAYWAVAESLYRSKL